MSDKSRAEFQAAIKAKFGQTPDELVAADDLPQDAEILIGMFWWAWQASREALVVTLPKPAFELDNGCGDNSSSVAANAMRSRCRWAIEASGVKVAP
jgi:hypothetical protein